MNQLTKLFLCILVAIAILALTYPAMAERDKATSKKDGFGLQISVEGLQPLTMSVKAGTQRLAFLPLKEAEISAVKVIPSVEGQSIKFNLLAVLDKLPLNATCANMKQLKTELVTSYVANEGDVIRVSDFEKFGVAPFTVKVISLAAAANVCPDGACCCGSMKCWPNPGQCIQCGPCGQCCLS